MPKSVDRQTDSFQLYIVDVGNSSIGNISNSGDSGNIDNAGGVLLIMLLIVVMCVTRQ